MITHPYRGGVIAALCVEDLTRFAANDLKIRAGLCPNGCGPMEPQNFGRLQGCNVCNFLTNVQKDVTT